MSTKKHPVIDKIEYIGLPHDYTGYFVKADGSVWWMAKGVFKYQAVPILKLSSHVD